MRGHAPPFTSDDDFRFGTVFKIEIPRGMHLISAEGSDHDEIAAVLEVKNRSRAGSPGLAPLSGQQNKRRRSEGIDEPPAR